MNLLRYVLRHTNGAVFTSAVLSVVSGFVTVALLSLVAAVLRTGTGTKRQMLEFVALIVAGPTIRLISKNLLVGIAERHARDLRAELTRRVLAASLRHVEQLGATRLVVALTDDVAGIALGIGAMPSLMVSTASAVGSLIYLGMLSLPIFVVMVATTAAAVGLQTVVGGRAMTWLRAARQGQDALQSHLRALTDGIVELKLNGARRRAFLSEQLRPALDGIATARTAGLSRYAVIATGQQLIFFAAIGVAVFGGSPIGMDAGTVGSVVLTLFYLRGAAENALGNIPAVRQTEIALQKYSELLALLPPEPTVPLPVAATGSFDRLDLVGVRYSYQEDGVDRFTLGPIDLTLRRGELVFIAGGNGSGKTTLAKLIAGLYLPAKGEIRLNGVPITGQEHAYRDSVTCVLSNFHLFDRLLGLGTGADQQAQAWLGRLHLSERVTVEDGRFSTLALSSGQRRRLALLVAILEDRPVCILDEWAADQDPQYRDEFYRRILPELRARNKALLVITHDDRYYGLGDRLVKLEAGRIASDELLDASLWTTAPAPGPVAVVDA